jgi:hypothetical protein
MFPGSRRQPARALQRAGRATRDAAAGKGGVGLADRPHALSPWLARRAEGRYRHQQRMAVAAARPEPDGPGRGPPPRADGHDLDGSNHRRSHERGVRRVARAVRARAAIAGVHRFLPGVPGPDGHGQSRQRELLSGRLAGPGGIGHAGVRAVRQTAGSSRCGRWPKTPTGWPWSTPTRSTGASRGSSTT